jgi:chitin disaccharide deacetylase
VKPTRYLIVNADDLGQSAGINRGISQAHEHGIVTSASLMVRWESAAQAAAIARMHPKLSLGLHLDLGEWAYRGRWVACYQRVPMDDARAVGAEVKQQLEMFRDLVNENPTHLDSHQHVHREEPVRSIMRELASELGVPLRDSGPNVRYEGGFYGQTGRGEGLPDIISVNGLRKILADMPPGITEMGCHPGLGDDLDSMYRRERAEELEVLCAPQVREILSAEGIELASFHDAIAQRDKKGA